MGRFSPPVAPPAASAPAAASHEGAYAAAASSCRVRVPNDIAAARARVCYRGILNLVLGARPLQACQKHLQAAVRRPIT